MYLLFFFFYFKHTHVEIPALTNSFPTRRFSDLYKGVPARWQVGVVDLPRRTVGQGVPAPVVAVQAIADQHAARVLITQRSERERDITHAGRQSRQEIRKSTRLNSSH